MTTPESTVAPVPGLDEDGGYRVRDAGRAHRIAAGERVIGANPG